MKRILTILLCCISLLAVSQSPTVKDIKVINSVKFIDTTGGVNTITDSVYHLDVNNDTLFFNSDTITLATHPFYRVDTLVLATDTLTKITVSGDTLFVNQDTLITEGSTDIDTVLFMSGTGYNSIISKAVGNTALDTGAFVIGRNNGVTGEWSFVYGDSNIVGRRSYVMSRYGNIGNSCIAIGDSATTAYTDSAVVIGSKASGYMRSVAIGTRAYAGNYSISIGANTYSTPNGTYSGIAIGNNSRATGNAAICIGNGTVSGVLGIKLGVDGFGRDVTNGGIMIGCNQNADVTTGIGIGNALQSGATHSTVIGNNANASTTCGNYSSALGYSAYCTGVNSTALGMTAYARKTGSTALGNNSTSNAIEGVGIGKGSYTVHTGAIGFSTGTYTGGRLGQSQSIEIQMQGQTDAKRVDTLYVTDSSTNGILIPTNHVLFYEITIMGMDTSTVANDSIIIKKHNGIVRNFNNISSRLMDSLAVTDNEIIIGYTSGSTTTDIKVLDSSPSDYIYFIVISENDRPKRWLANLRIKMMGFSDYLYNLSIL